MMRSVYDEDCLNYYVVLGWSASVTWTVHRVPRTERSRAARITLIINWTDLIINLTDLIINWTDVIINWTDVIMN